MMENTVLTKAHSSENLKEPMMERTLVSKKA